MAVAATDRLERWGGHPIQAALLRGCIWLAPLAVSVVFVRFASQVVPAPAGSLWLFLLWWLGLSALATVVLVLVDRATRRVLPLAALLRLSLVFPDQAPSRFKVALRSGSVERLRDRVAATEAAAAAITPSDSAARLLELVAALNIHDSLTRGHCERVRAYSVMIGEELGLTAAELDLLNWAALLHDVGKLLVPGEILAKTGKPSAEEWGVLRRHPLFGEELVEPMREWLGVWTEAIGFHHERWDGTGYPHGLQGESIPLAGRIVAVADVFDVMTSSRSYKKGGAASEARAELARCAGSQFDPAVVRAFLNVSLGRMRLVMGPLSWLAHAPLLGRLPLTPAMGTLAGAFTVAAGSAAGVLATPPTTAAAQSRPVAHVAADDRSRGVPTLRVRDSRRRSTRGAGITAPRNSPDRAAVVVAPRARPALVAAVTPVTITPRVPVPPAAAPPPPAPAAPPPPISGAAAAVDDRASVHEGGSIVIDVLANDAGEPLRLASVSPPGHGDARLLGDRVVYSAPLGWNGVDTFPYRIIGGDGVTETALVRVEVRPVNHAPVFQPGGDVTVSEDSPPVERAWASSIAAGAGDGNQSVHFLATASDPELFSTQPSVSADGRLAFTPAPDANGISVVEVVAVDDGGRGFGGADRTLPVSVTIDILPVNDPPTYQPGGDVSVIEGAGPQTRAWASRITPGPQNEAGQAVQISASDDNAALFAPGGRPAIDRSGTLTFVPRPLASGTATVTVTARDDGGVANGGDDRSSSTFTIEIVAVNQPPTFTGAAGQTVFEDAGPQSSQWATNIGPGAPDETAQSVTLSATNDRPALFSAQPSLDDAGLLTYTPAPNANGSATVTVTARDDGGTARNGHDTTTATFAITVVAVNDAPTVAGAGNQFVLENAGPQAVTWLSTASPGPTDESGQTISYLTTNDNPTLFAVGGDPSVAGSGVLTYEPAPGQTGTATVIVTAQDDGGTAGGGQDSTTVTFVITVSAVNQPPTFTAGGNRTVLEDAGGQSSQWATAISPGPPNESTQTVTFSATNDNNALFASQPSLTANGVLTYTPAANGNGVATVTLTAHDDGGTSNGGNDSTSATFTITVTAVNDPPTLTPLANQTVIENAGPQATPLTTIAPGPADEGAQTVALSTSTDHPELFTLAAQPTLDAGGNLTYTPLAGAYGVATVTVSATDNGGTLNGGNDAVARSFTITIVPLAPIAGNDSYTTARGSPLLLAAPGVLANDTDPSATGLSVASAGNVSTTAGGTATLQANGAFTYTPPPSPGPFTDSFTYQVVDGNNRTATGTVTITVIQPTIVLSPATLPAATTGTAYVQTFASGGGTSPYSYSVSSGALPAGLVLSSGGLLSGTPTVSGSFSFTVTATDSTGGGAASGSQAYTLSVNAATILLGPATLPPAAIFAPYSQTLTASGGVAPYTYALSSGSLPAGMSLSSAGVLAGTPASGGAFTFTVTATDSSAGGGPYSGSQSYTLGVTAFGGITFANPSKATTCTGLFNPTGVTDLNAFPAAICSSDANAGPGTFSWNVKLATGTPESPTPVSALAPVTVTVTNVTTSGTNGGQPPSLTSPTTAIVATGSTTTATSFSVGNIGGGDWIQVTCTVTVGPWSFTLTMQVH